MLADGGYHYRIKHEADVNARIASESELRVVKVK
jgi:hypothetical protein